MNESPFYTSRHNYDQDIKKGQVMIVQPPVNSNKSSSQCQQTSKHIENASKHTPKRVQKDFNTEEININKHSLSPHDKEGSSDSTSIPHEIDCHDERNDYIKRKINDILMEKYSAGRPWKPSSLIFNHDGNVRKAIFISLIICLHSVHRPINQRIEWNVRFSSLSILHINHEVFFELNINPNDYENEELKSLSRYALEYIDTKVNRDYKSKRNLFMTIERKPFSLENSLETILDGNDSTLSFNENEQVNVRKIKTWYYYKLTECIDIPLFKHILDAFMCNDGLAHEKY